MSRIAILLSIASFSWLLPAPPASAATEQTTWGRIKTLYGNPLPEILTDGKVTGAQANAVLEAIHDQTGFRYSGGVLVRRIKNGLLVDGYNANGQGIAFGTDLEGRIILRATSDGVVESPAKTVRRMMCATMGAGVMAKCLQGGGAGNVLTAAGCVALGGLVTWFCNNWENMAEGAINDDSTIHRNPCHYCN